MRFTGLSRYRCQRSANDAERRDDRSAARARAAGRCAARGSTGWPASAGRRPELVERPAAGVVLGQRALDRRDARFEERLRLGDAAPPRVVVDAPERPDEAVEDVTGRIGRCIPRSRVGPGVCRQHAARRHVECAAIRTPCARLSANRQSPVASAALTSSDSPFPCARPEYHGARSSCRYGQSKWCIHTGTPWRVRRQLPLQPRRPREPGRLVVLARACRTSG